MKVLLTGNISYITTDWIRQSFSGCRIVLVGETSIHSDLENGISVVSNTKEYESLFEAHGFDAVILFSNSLTFRSQEKGELEWLMSVLDACRKNAPVKVLYLTGPDMNGAIEQAVSDAAVQMCMHLAGEHIQMQVIRSLHLYSGAFSGEWFYRLFEELERRRRFHFEENPKQPLCFLAMDDLSEIIRRMLEDWPKTNEIWKVPECFHHTFGQLGEELKKLNGQWSFSYDENAQVFFPHEDDRKLRRQYGWFPRYAVLDDLPQLYRQFQHARPEKKGFIESIRRRAAGHRKLLLLAEWMLAIGLTVLCGHLSRWQVQFGLIDFRLLMIVLMGTMHGMNMGLLSAAAASAMLLFAYHQQGIGWITLFYEPTNWIAFVAYFMVGAVCGYVRLYHTDKIRFTSAENERLKEKLTFAQEMYHEVLSDKREYKKQIVSSKDSFGKIFQITQRLNVMHEKEVFIQTVDVLETIMENQSVALYRVGAGQHYGRLIASSKQITPLLPASIRLDAYEEALQTVRTGNVFVNNQLLDGYPAFMSGVIRDGEIRMLVMLHHAKFEQMSLYYMNLFHILCGLVSSALNHAMDYQQAQQPQNCVPGTGILNAEYFEKELKLHHLMDDRRIATHMLLRGNM